MEYDWTGKKAVRQLKNRAFLVGGLVSVVAAAIYLL